MCVLLAQLALQIKEVNEEVEISWGVFHLDSNLQLTPSFIQVYSHIEPLEIEHIIIKCSSNCTLPSFVNLSRFWKGNFCLFFQNAHDSLCVFQGDCESLSEFAVNDRLRQVLSRAQASVTLSSRPAESAEVKVLSCTNVLNVKY